MVQPRLKKRMLDLTGMRARKARDCNTRTNEEGDSDISLVEFRDLRYLETTPAGRKL